MYGYGYKYTASGSIGSNVNPLPTSVAFTIGGLAAEQTDYVLKLHLHKGTKPANAAVTGEDLWLGDIPANDFSDVKFETAAGVAVPHYLHSTGNHEVIKDSGLGGYVFAHAGKLFAKGGSFGIVETGVVMSTDNGATWTTIYANSNDIVFVTSAGIVFVTDGYVVKRSNDTTYAAWTTVLDFTAVNGVLYPGLMAEGVDGVLVCGRYQSANSISVRRSTDHGATWTETYTETNNQHCHGVHYDSYTGAWYVGLDGTTNRLLKSTDNGLNWVASTPIPQAGFIQMFSGSGYRLLSGETAIISGSTIYRSTDDTTWTPVLTTRQNAFCFNRIGSKIFAAGNGYRNGYPQTWVSEDEGLTWKTIQIDKFTPSLVEVNSGFRWFNNITPTGDVEQIIGFSSVDAYKPARIRSGGSHYSALVYLKIPTLPTAGLSMVAKAEGTPTAFTGIFNNAHQPNSLFRLKMNDTDLTTLLDDSGNNRHFTRQSGNPTSNAFGGKRAGEMWPHCVFESKSLAVVDLTRYNLAGSGAVPALDIVKNFTLSVWIKAAAYGGGGAKHIIGKGLTSNFTILRLTETTLGTVNFQYSNGVATTNTLDIVGGVQNGWNHILITLSNDATPILQRWLNGYKMPNVTLGFNPVCSGYDWQLFASQIGTASTRLQGAAYFELIAGVVTDQQALQMYEARPVAATEPAITL